MTSLEEAMELKVRVNNALLAMKSNDTFINQVREEEVRFRFDSIVGILIMACNDINQMISYWEVRT